MFRHPTFSDSPVVTTLHSLICSTFRVGALLFAAHSLPASTLYWDANGPLSGVGGTGLWNSTNLLWRLDSPTGELTGGPSAFDLAIFSGTVGSITLGESASVAGLQALSGGSVLSSAPGALLELFTTGPTPPEIAVALGQSLTINAQLAAPHGVALTGGGSITLGHTANALGPIQLDARLTAANAPLALRDANIEFANAAAALLWSSSELSLGGLQGEAGSVNGGTYGATQHLHGESTFGGNIFAGNSSHAWTMRGLGTQTFTGASLPNAAFVVYGVGSADDMFEASAKLVLGGEAGVQSTTANSVVLRGGAFTLDASTGVSTNRFRDAAHIESSGGVFSYVGFESDTDYTEKMGELSLTGGVTTISFEPALGSYLTTLEFADMSTAPNAVVHFSGGRGERMLGDGNDRIMFTTPLPVVSGLIASSTAGGARRGFAVVTAGPFGDTDFASYDEWGGVVPVFLDFMTDDSDPEYNASLNVEISAFSYESTGETSQTIAVNTLTIREDGVLDISGTGDFGAHGILHTGPGIGSIVSTGGGKLASGPSVLGTPTGSTRYIWVMHPDGVLEVDASLAGTTSGIVKAGVGVLSLVGSTNQLNFAGTASVTIAQGVLRGTLANLGNVRTGLQLRGGVLEIAGGGAFARPLGLSGNINTGVLNWTTSPTDRGTGGFSAINGDASITITAGTGSSQPAPLIWGGTAYFVQDGYALLFGSREANSLLDFRNSIALDAGTPTTYAQREFRVTDNLYSTGDRVRLSGVLTGSAQTDFVKSGDGELELTGANTYAGATLIREGTLSVAGENRLPAGGRVNVSAAAEMVIRQGNQRIGVLTGEGIVLLGQTTLTVGGAESSTFTGNIVALSGSATGTLQKIGSGILELRGRSAIPGGVSISGGSLLVNNDTPEPGLAGGDVIAEGSGVRVGGDGWIESELIVRGGATLSPGETGRLGSIGELRLEALTLGEGGRLELEIGPAGTAHDRLAIDGAVRLQDGTLALHWSPGFIPEAPLFLLANAGADPIQGVFNAVTGLPAQLAIYYSADLATGALTGGNDIAVFIPEPGCAALLAFGAATLFRRSRRRGAI